MLSSTKNIIFYIILIFYTIQLNCSQQMPIQGTPVYFTINTNQNNQNQSSNVNENIAITHNIYTYLDKARPFINSFGNSIITYIKEHPFKILLYFTGTIYTTLLIYSHTIQQFISNESKWHRWKYYMTIDDIIQNEDFITIELLKEIQNRYFNANDPLNYIESIGIFFADIKKDVDLINQFIRYIEIIDKLKISHILFTMNASIEYLSSAKTRLLLLKTYCKKWCCNQKLDVIKK
jgi:hypothetical protein